MNKELVVEILKENAKKLQEEINAFINVLDATPCIKDSDSTALQVVQVNNLIKGTSKAISNVFEIK